jgi:hypothetical protein
MHVVILSIGFDKARLKLMADAGKDLTQCLMRGFRQDFPAVLGHKYQMDVQRKHTMSAGTKIGCIFHRPIV